MIKPICRMGNPILREVAKEITLPQIKSDEISRLLVDMYDSMKHYGGIGIAAPQIGVSLQITIIELIGFNRYDEDVSLPLTTFINPKIEYLSEEKQGFWEGCLSAPGLRGFVERPRKVRVNFLDETGAEREIVAEGFLATVLQHELDHLQGTLYIDRISDSRLLSYQEEFDIFIQSKDSVD